VECGIEMSKSEIRNPKSEVLKTIQGLLARYQRHLVLHAGAVGMLGLGCLVALGWRLSHYGLKPGVLLGIGLGTLLGLSLWQWRALRRAWLHLPHAALKLDQALRLEARLLTAAQFAHVPNPPPLYPVLIQDPALSLSSSEKHLPRIADRWTIALALMLLVLVVWPARSVLPTTLAMRTPSAQPPSEPPPPAAVPPEPSKQQQQAQEHQQPPQVQQPFGLGATAQQDCEAGGGDSSAGQQSSAAGQTSEQGTSKDSQVAQAKSPSSQTAQQAQGQAQQSKADSTTPRQTADTKPTSQQQQDASQQQARQSTGRSADKPSQPSTRDSHKTGTASTQSSAQRQGSAKTDQTLQQRSQTAQGQGATPSSSGQQDLLKADIQQLLKEMSQELQQLQEQLVEHKDLPNPTPGTATDPQLYEDAASLEKAAGAPLPIQLEVDQQPASSKRRAGGVGEPSEQVADASPQQTPEDVTLGEQAAEEQAVSRQPIPPEYRPVFERLSPPENQP
jgi:hypothetical protein